MEKYNYIDAMVSDILEYMEENHIEKIAKGDEDAKDELAEKLQDELWIEDSVTGNASGSYTCNAWKAEEMLCHNWDLLADAIEEFGGNTDVLRQGPEVCDVTIRCYLLYEATEKAIRVYSEWEN